MYIYSRNGDKSSDDIHILDPAVHELLLPCNGSAPGATVFSASPFLWSGPRVWLSRVLGSRSHTGCDQGAVAEEPLLSSLSSSWWPQKIPFQGHSVTVGRPHDRAGWWPETLLFAMWAASQGSSQPGR